MLIKISVLAISFVLILSSSLYGTPPLYVALNHTRSSQQIRKVLTTNYIALGSEQYYYDIDEYRNRIRSKLDIRIIEWPEHNEIFCPSVKFGEGLEYQSLPEGEFAEDEIWLFFFEYMLDIYEYENRVKKWNERNTTIRSSMWRSKYPVYYEYMDDEEIIGLTKQFTYTFPPKPQPIRSPIKYWEYK